MATERAPEAGANATKEERATPRDPVLAHARDLPPTFETYDRESLPQVGVGSPGKVGELEATFATDADGRTRLVADYARVPYHLSGTLDHDVGRPEFSSAYVQSPTGGVAQGDRNRMHVTAEADARAHVSTGSATKVLSMDANYGRVDASFVVDDGAHLEYVPEQTILHPDARYCGETAVTLGRDASAILTDVVVPGRLARDEAFDFERYYARTTVDGPDGRILADTTHLAPDDPHADPRTAGVLGDYAVLGTCYVATTRDVDSGTLSDRLVDRIADGPARASASTLPLDGGAVVRALGDRADDVRAALDAAWDEASRVLLDAPAPDQRKY
ncbi:urease accessory protein ureD [Halarchaeum acidiphilum MH1-52-1]|uniref:Urease accessory protein UreD n=1 Tax=Halarchaeum acidiphilum MH1-52-1 TaxID=1261545 RepID=U2YGM3_9EURY|nr:urease accessory protein UreD [Halarchaeum acidiphilum]GAD53466.1 urease accessory protein ureD [Halarchaeum acidiphilum MH1-52-1]